jgi:hypothetical protein
MCPSTGEPPDEPPESHPRATGKRTVVACCGSPVPILGTTRAAAALFITAFAGAGVSTGCSLVVESQDRQCESDADCSVDGSVCDVAGGVCVARAETTSSGLGTTSGSSSGGGGNGAGGGGSTSTGDECIGPDGCFACAPDTQPEFLNGCTDAACVPYDNAQIADLLEEDGSVPPVP